MCATCAALRHEIVMLKQEIAEWEAWAKDERVADADEHRLAAWRQVFGARGPAPVLALMALADKPGRLINPQAIIAATRFGQVRDSDEVAHRSLSTTRICQVRNVLKALASAGRLPGVFAARDGGVATIWGQGWTMTAENAAAVRALAGEA